MSTFHIIVSGKVQGVFFRVNARNKASELGLTGWVKNTPEGKVEIVATGNDQSLFHFTEWCKRGPEKAEVADVAITKCDPQIFSSFIIIR